MAEQEERLHHATLRLARGFEFVAEFNDLPDAPAILFDEPPPLGTGSGPPAAAVLGAAVGNCLAASLEFCLKRSHVPVEGLSARVTTHVTRNEQGRFRVSGIDVELTPDLGESQPERVQRCEEIFEQFCTVTESVRKGIPVNVTVNQPTGVEA